MNTPTDDAETAQCPACSTPIGQPHTFLCETARCLQTGLQRLYCPHDHDCGTDRWTGRWPGEAECEEYGFLTPAGDPDLNRLYVETTWDSARHRWILPTGPNSATPQP